MDFAITIAYCLVVGSGYRLYRYLYRSALDGPAKIVCLYGAVLFPVLTWPWVAQAAVEANRYHAAISGAQRAQEDAVRRRADIRWWRSVLRDPASHTPAEVDCAHQVLSAFGVPEAEPARRPRCDLAVECDYPLCQLSHWQGSCHH